jgi:hypothetical protein
MRQKGSLPRAVACLTVLLSCMNWASAEITIVPFGSEDTGEHPIGMVETPQGKLLVLNSVMEYDPSGTSIDPRVRSFLNVISPENGARRSIELPAASYTNLVALADGAAAWQRLTTTPATPHGQIVAISADDSTPPRVIYEPSEHFEWLYLDSSADAQALYIAETQRSYRMRVTKIDRTGRQAWQKTFENSHASNLTATTDGVALIRGVDINGPASRRVLTRLSGEGEVLWDAPVSIESGGVGTLLFQRTGFIAVADGTHDERHRLTQYDLDTGRIVRTVFIPLFHRLRGTRDGVLLWHQLYREPYVAMIGDDGTVAWQRRFAAGDGVGYLSDGLITHSGRFAFLSKWQTTPHGGERVSLAITDRTALSLQQERGACSRADLLPVLEMERKLRRHHAIDVSLAFDPHAFNRPHDRGSCARPTDGDYESFVREVTSKLKPNEGLVDQMRQRVYVSVAASDRPVRIINYALGRGASHSPERFVTLEVRYDAGAQLVQYLNSTMLPHLAKMQTFRERLFELTGCWIGALTDPDDVAAPRFLQDMEQAASIVYGHISALDPSTVESISRRRNCGGARLLMHHDAFGGSLDEMLPLESSGETFLRLVEGTSRRP